MEKKVWQYRSNLWPYVRLWRACEHGIIMIPAECWRVLLWSHHLAYRSHHSCKSKSRGVVGKLRVIQRSGVAASKQSTFNVKVRECEPLRIVRNLGRNISLSYWWIVWSCYSPGLSHQSDVQLNRKIMESLHIVIPWQNTEDPPPMVIRPNIAIKITLAMLCHGWSLLHANILWEFVVGSFTSLPRRW